MSLTSRYFEKMSMSLPARLLLSSCQILKYIAFEFACSACSVARNLLNSNYLTLILLLLPIVLSCSKSENPEVGNGATFSAEVMGSIQQDLGILHSQTLEILDFRLGRPDMWGQTESATILISTDDKFQLALVTRELRGTMSRWSIHHIDVLLIDGSGEVIVFEREFDHRPSEEEIEAFRMWRDRW